MRRPPAEDDITRIAAALAAHGVEYAMIGGAAMALHGFARMTKDIDLLLPVDADNNQKLVEALRNLPGAEAAATRLRTEGMDKGHSTELLVEVGGVKVRTLDVDGMLLPKAIHGAARHPRRMKPRVGTCAHHWGRHGGHECPPYEDGGLLSSNEFQFRSEFSPATPSRSPPRRSFAWSSWLRRPAWRPLGPGRGWRRSGYAA
jgi:hypothetical protein